MREIKIRIFDKKNKKILEVDTLFINEGMFKPVGGDEYSVWNYDTEYYSNPMQYTGLKDKNGVEIYEGDIVNFQHIDDYGYMTNVFQNGFYRGVVKWGEHYPAFDIFDIKDNSTFGFDCNIFSMESDIVIEVIGNICENKELLTHQNRS